MSTTAAKVRTVRIGRSFEPGAIYRRSNGQMIQWLLGTPASAAWWRRIDTHTGEVIGAGFVLSQVDALTIRLAWRADQWAARMAARAASKAASEARPCTR